jgi:hypothetical protein
MLECLTSGIRLFAESERPEVKVSAVTQPGSFVMRATSGGVLWGR